MLGWRKSYTIIPLFLVHLILLSCHSTQDTRIPGTVKAEPTGPPEPQKSANDWQRMKQCAEQTDRVAKRAGWAEGQRNGEVTTMGWQNHYSPKYERCYILVNYVNHRAEKNGDLPLLYDELFDAFEGGLLSVCTDAVNSKASFFCSIQADESPHFDCRACRQFAKDRMEK